MDLNAIKQRMQSLQNKGKGGAKNDDRAKNFWVPPVGNQVDR